jgi:hypothetical protein
MQRVNEQAPPGICRCAIGQQLIDIMVLKLILRKSLVFGLNALAKGEWLDFAGCVRILVNEPAKWSTSGSPVQYPSIKADCVAELSRLLEATGSGSV